jgi:hypothetical protein
MRTRFSSSNPMHATSEGPVPPLVRQLAAAAADLLTCLGCIELFSHHPSLLLRSYGFQRFSVVLTSVEHEIAVALKLSSNRKLGQKNNHH